MNLDHLRQKLVAAARAHPPSDQVPYAFEQRIMARLRAAGVSDLWPVWTRVWWRATMPCLAIALGLGAWSYSLGGPDDAAAADPDLESTVYAAIDTSGDGW